MVELIRHHELKVNVGLFKSESGYWIGCFFMDAQPAEGSPPYILYDGIFDTEEAALAALGSLIGE